MANGIAYSWMWCGFIAFVVLALTMDTLLLNTPHFKRKPPAPNESIPAALTWSLFWIACALVFSVVLWGYVDAYYGHVVANEKTLLFLTGYFIEKSLSVDNLFVFYMVFTHFRITPAYQQRIFTYGIWSAIVLRLLLILLGIWLVNQFHWLLIFMGVFLVLTGLKIFQQEKAVDFKRGWLFNFLTTRFRVTSTITSPRFFVRKQGLLYATPLFIALIYIEISDLIFALDSIPAIFAITTEPFLVWSSNIFAILGLRALYFVLLGMVNRFELLKYGVGLILVFVGTKMAIEPILHIPTGLSLFIIAFILALFSWLSMRGTTNASH